MVDLVKHLLKGKVSVTVLLALFGMGTSAVSAYYVVTTNGHNQQLQHLITSLQAKVSRLEQLINIAGTSTPSLIAQNTTSDSLSNADNEFISSELIAGRGIRIINNIISNTGIISLSAGDGIAVSGSTITNTGITSLEAGDGIAVSGNEVSNNDRGSAQSIFKNIKIGDTDTIAASANNDTLTFLSGTGISLSTDTSNKKITITNTVTSASLGGWSTATGLVYPTDTTDDLVVGGSSSLGKLSIVGTSDEKQLVLRGHSSQTAALLDLQNSSGTSLATFNSSGVLSLPSNGLNVGTNQLVVSSGRVGIGTSSPSVALDVNGSVKIATNNTLTLTANTPSTGSISRLITLKATSQYDRPWISSIDHNNRHVASMGIHSVDINDDTVQKRWEIKTVADAAGSIPEVMLTRFAIDYDRDLADIIFSQIDSIGVHNDYGDRVKFVHQMRDAADTGSYVIGQWITELGNADSTVMTIDPKTLNATTDTTLRFFRETSTSGQRRFVLNKGDGTSAESFVVNAGTGVVSINGNAGSLLMGDGTNTSAYINMQSNRTLMGYDGSYATLQGGTNKGIKFNVNASSFGQGTVMTILSTGEVGIGTTSPAALLSVGSGSPFQVNSSGAIAAANGITSSGTITLSGLNTAGGVVVTNGSGVLSSVAGTSGQCLVSNGTSAPSWSSCGSGSGASNWRYNLGGISPINDTVDFLVGANATSSAKFALINVNGTRGQQTASVSGSLMLDSSGSLQTTKNQALTIGGSSTGNIVLSPQNGTGRVGIGTTTPAATLHVATAGETLRIGDGANTSSYINIQANRTMTGYDGSYAVLQGGTSKGIKLNVNNASFGQGTAVTILSSGYVGIGTTNPTLGPLEMASGAYVTTGGDWTNASDRNLKENFKPVAAEDILEKIAQLEITEWNYIAEADTVRHIGPMAQDFYAVFGLGNSDRSISTIDPSGVALLGIKGLNSKLTALAETVKNTSATQAAASQPTKVQTTLPELTVEGDLNGIGNLTVQGTANIKGESVFEKLVTFVSNVIFKGRVRFEQAPVFASNTGGSAVIKPGADQVKVTFSQKYEHSPQVTANITSGSAEAEAAVFNNNLKFVIKDISPEGFIIKLNQAAPQEVSFSWLALAVDQAQTSVGSELTSPAPTTSPTNSAEPSPITSPLPVISGVTNDVDETPTTSSSATPE